MKISNICIFITQYVRYLCSLMKEKLIKYEIKRQQKNKRIDIKTACSTPGIVIIE